MKGKLIFLLIGWTVLQLIGSCCNCGKGSHRWDNLRLAAGVFRNGKVDTSGLNPIPSNSISVRMKLDVVYEAILWNKVPQFETAIACKCSTTIDDQIKDIKFISIHDWDSSHRAGTDITNLLEGRSGGYVDADHATDTTFQPLASAVSIFNSGILYVRPISSKPLPGIHELYATVTVASGREISSKVNFEVR